MATTPAGFVGMYDFKETLGEGHFSVVKKAEHLLTKLMVAVKIIDKTKLEKTELAHLHHEVRLMKNIRHPHIVRLYQEVDTGSRLFLIMELGDGGDLWEYIQTHGALPETRAREIFRQITAAMDYCHRNRIAHRDLKPENVVFCTCNGTQVAKLTDFGLSNNYKEGQMMETSCGSMAYSAPEVLLCEPYSGPAADVWSLGIILYMLVTGRQPFNDANESATLVKIMDVKYEPPPGISPLCADLLTKLIVRDPKLRPCTQDILDHSWVLGCDTARRESQVSFTEPELVRDPSALPSEDHERVLAIMEKLNISRSEVVSALQRNTYDYISSTYMLLLEEQRRVHRFGHASTRSVPASPVVSPDLTPAQSPATKNKVPKHSTSETNLQNQDKQDRVKRTGKHTGSLRARQRPSMTLPDASPNGHMHAHRTTQINSLALSPRLDTQNGKGGTNFSFDQPWISGKTLPSPLVRSSDDDDIAPKSAPLLGAPFPPRASTTNGHFVSDIDEDTRELRTSKSTPGFEPVDDNYVSAPFPRSFSCLSPSLSTPPDNHLQVNWSPSQNGSSPDREADMTLTPQSPSMALSLSLPPVADDVSSVDSLPEHEDESDDADECAESAEAARASLARVHMFAEEEEEEEEA